MQTKFCRESARRDVGCESCDNLKWNILELARRESLRDGSDTGAAYCKPHEGPPPRVLADLEDTHVVFIVYSSTLPTAVSFNSMS